MKQIKKIKFQRQKIVRQSIIYIQNNRTFFIFPFHYKHSDFHFKNQIIQHLSSNLSHILINSIEYKITYSHIFLPQYFAFLSQLRSKLLDYQQNQTELIIFVAYQIFKFKIYQSNEVGSVYYGTDLYSQNQMVGYISNMFNFRNYIYFLYSSENDVQNKVIQDISNRPIGYTYKFDKLNVFVSFEILLRGKLFKGKIVSQIQNLMQNICYVQYTSNYCTGILISQKKVICTKHVLPISNQKQKQQINIRLFPFKKVVKGVVKKLQVFDYIQIQLQEKYTKYANIPFNLTQKLAEQVIILGFGKFSFRIINFLEVDILPTLQKGMISKIIHLNNESIYIKTSANLYNGFSGSGIWTKDGLAGMAVFIIKNGNNSLSYHNYSYSMNFLNKFRILNIQSYIEQFEKIGMRKYVPMYTKL